MIPPLRSSGSVRLLKKYSEFVETIGTDHCPFFYNGRHSILYEGEEVAIPGKELGNEDFTKIPNGIPSIEERVRMFYTHGVATGRIDLNSFVNLLSTQAAKLFGLYPRKGTIRVGSDADIVVYDPSYEGVISAATHHQAVDYNAFEGWAVKGRCDAVTVRGHVQVREGEFVGTKGIGQFLRRERVY